VKDCDKKTIKIMNNIIINYLAGKLTRDAAVKKLIFTVDIENVVLRNDVDPIIYDCYYTIKYLTHGGGFDSTDFEMMYFRDCFNGTRKYDVDEKLKLTKEYLDALK